MRFLLLAFATPILFVLFDVDNATADKRHVELNASRGEAQHVFEIGSLVS